MVAGCVLDLSGTLGFRDSVNFRINIVDHMEQGWIYYFVSSLPISVRIPCNSTGMTLAVTVAMLFKNRDDM